MLNKITLIFTLFFLASCNDHVNKSLATKPDERFYPIDRQIKLPKFRSGFKDKSLHTPDKKAKERESYIEHRYFNGN